MATPDKRKHDSLRHDVPMRPWTVLAQDPGLINREGGLVTTQVMVPAERLERGPKGHRVHVIDYDASADLFYRSRDIEVDTDHYENVHDANALLGDCYFHQQNVYAIAMATLHRFECALGRPVQWGFRDGQQLKIAPHAYADANANYSRESESLSFGYFPDDNGTLVYTCLSHDIIVHETTHALLDGLRPFYMKPSSTDQAGFHEGFADIVALLSVFGAKEVVEEALRPLIEDDGRIRMENLAPDKMADNTLMTLANQMGQALRGVPTAALRASLKIQPDESLYASERYAEEHDRGELLVAVIMRAFMATWYARLLYFNNEDKLAYIRPKLVIEEGCTAAEQLLRVVIRAIDYLPPVDMTFPDYVSALLTADIQLNPDDSKYGYREILLKLFRGYGIEPASRSRSDGAWEPPPNASSLNMSGLHLERLQREPTEAFRFVWENRDALGIDRDAFTRVTSVQPVVRVGNDWAILRETVATYVQTLRVRAAELSRLDIDRPPGLDDDNYEIVLHGGGTLIFDEFGRLKFHIGTGVRSSKQSARVRSLWERGELDGRANVGVRIARMHRDRVLRRPISPMGVW
ncbi:hypothetical protein JI752_006785 [Lysobacter sp. MMG2]|uniref:hypothetical protein n=1 Tax=Lysobacter sp. MMG2 TaxID=2801338 RepID=UPI001C211B3F|nr:hypothetical protein [Lysobacter sp. MMG2]MBU8975845.1 hypothetical protein [Lysobacter sp. MMG2]